MGTRLTILLASVIWLAGCTTAPPRPMRLPMPARPVLPTVSRAELQCLPDSTYTKIVNRERGYKGWGLQLEAIIETNNDKAGID